MIRRHLRYAAGLCLAALGATPAAAQHAGHAGHAGPATPPAAPAIADPHAGHVMPSGGMEPEAGGDVTAPAGTDLEPGSAPAPAPPTDHYADRFWPAEAMAARRGELRAEHGGQSFSQLMFNLAEVRPESGRDAFRWDGEAWFGGDIDRLTLKTEGEGSFGEGVEAAEVQLLYSHPVDAYWNVQVGVRHDFRPDPERTYATLAVEGLAPYWFDVEAALFLSDKGDLLGRIEGYYDQRLTNRLILQPRAELNFAAQDVAENAIGSGMSDAEIGLRLRYEFRREFAPYVGFSWERKIGDTARFARAAGGDRTGAGIVAGVRFWF
jgi:copper resistance protein B